ncbi:MAG: sulfatase [Polyangiaceae bacterium]
MLLGALLGVALTVNFLVDALLDDRINGVSAPTIHRFLATEFRNEVVRAVVLVLALSVLLGSVVGLLVALAERLRARWLQLPEPGAWTRRLRATLGWCAIAVLVYFHDMAARPALHQSFWFERGGVRRLIQVTVSDGLGRGGVVSLAVALGASYLVWALRRHPQRRRKLIQLLGAGAAVIVLLGVLGASRSGWRGHVARAASAQKARPNVLVLAADSLRPDHIDDARAPRLTELERHSLVFDRALTPLARTFPAWVSIATGKYPHHHGIRHMFPRWETREQVFDTLGKRFADAGYRTSVVGDFAADIFRRIDLGFEHVRTPTFTLRELVREHLFKNDPWLLAFLRGGLARWLVPQIVEMHEATDPWAVTQDAIDEIDRAGDEPFFLTVFYSTTHFPYATPGPYHALFRAKSYDGPFRYAKADDLTVGGSLAAADVDQIRALFDGAVRATDDAIGVLLDDLKTRGLAENTVIVVTADHGEQLYEHGRTQGHGDHLFGDESLRVPLILHDPRRPSSKRYPGTVSLVDIAPTLLELSGLPALSAADGRSLARLLDGQTVESVPIYSETGLWFTELIPEVPPDLRLFYPDLTRISEVDRVHGDQIVIRKRYEALAVAAKHRMVEFGEHRLLYAPTRRGPRYFLFDRRDDPGMVRDVAAEHPEIVASLKTLLFRYVDVDPFVERRGEQLWPR